MTPFHSISRQASSRHQIFIFGDHTSAVIPEPLEGLGLSGDDLTRHIAVDIGTEGLVRGLCSHFGCGGHLAGVSRLVADCNRDPLAEGLIPKVSDGTVIKGNADIDIVHRAHRLAHIHTAYHEGLQDAIDKELVSGFDPFILSIHSFTPKLKTSDQIRPTEIGLLYKGDISSAQKIQNALLDQTDFVIGMNKPYSGFELYYSVDRHATDRGLRHIAIEVRQDLIDTADKEALMVTQLASVLDEVI